MDTIDGWFIKSLIGGRLSHFEPALFWGRFTHLWGPWFQRSDQQRWANGKATTAKTARQWLWFHRPRGRRIHVRLALSGQAAAPVQMVTSLQLGVAENGVDCVPNGCLSTKFGGFSLIFRPSKPSGSCKMRHNESECTGSRGPSSLLQGFLWRS